MTPRGPQGLGIVVSVILVGIAASLLGCASLGPVTPVTVPDVKSVTGNWKGIVYRSGFPGGDTFTLTIHDDGTYEVVSAAQGGSAPPIGISRGHGTITIKDGRLLFEGVKGRGVGTLLRNPAGDLVMNVDASLSDSSTVTGKLFPAP